MNIRMIAFDLDGTLLASDKTVSGRNIAALEQCARMGIRIVPATGRTVAGIPEAVRTLPGIEYAITTNGAVVTDLTRGQVILEQKMSSETATQILRLVASYPVLYDAYIGGRGKTEPFFLAHMDDFNLTSHTQDLIRATRDVVPSLLSYIEDNQLSVEKFNIFVKDAEGKEEMRRLLSGVPGILVTSSMPNNLEINDEKANKGEAILALARYLSIDERDTMSFGDGENDLTMLSRTGWGIAMGNAEPAAKRLARFVTDSNDEDGIANAIETLMFGRE